MSDDAEALRAALLDVLIEMGSEMLRSVEGRETVAALYEAQAERAHPAVAEVLREAAERVRGGVFYPGSDRAIIRIRQTPNIQIV